MHQEFHPRACHIIETKNYLVLQDTFRYASHNRELIKYLESLGKPLDRIIISHGHDHHYLGLEMFPGVPVYANAVTIEEIRKLGAEVLELHKKRKGIIAVPYKNVIVPQRRLSAGDVLIDDLVFRFSLPRDACLVGKIHGKQVTFIEFPDQKAIILHHLAYVGMHFPPISINARIELLKRLKAKSYRWVMAGHGKPMGPEFFDHATDYLKTAQKALDNSPDIETARSKMIQAYPDWAAPILLKMWE